MRPGTQPPRALNLSQVVVSVFDFRIVNTSPASINFRKFFARPLSEITIVKRVCCRVNGGFTKNTKQTERKAPDRLRNKCCNR